MSVCVCEGVRVGVRVGGLRSVTPSPHAAGAQRLTQLRAGPRVPQRDGGWRCFATTTFMLPVQLRSLLGWRAADAGGGREEAGRRAGGIVRAR